MKQDKQGESELIGVHGYCNWCAKGYKQLRVEKQNYYAWREKTVLEQDAFPELSVEDRQLIISHTCVKCWSEMSFCGGEYETG